MSNKILTGYLPIDKLHPFETHPFQVKDDEEMNQLVWSIITQGVLNPIMVRPPNTGEYEMISGHRSVHTCQKGLLQNLRFVTVPFQFLFIILQIKTANHFQHICKNDSTAFPF